jgi:hypothetical protein
VSHKTPVTTSTPPRLSPSVFDLDPLEHGGEDARQGFGFQDHVAAGLCIDMLLDGSIKEIWCETHDDITLLFETNSTKDLRVEFIQVKGHELDQLWSVAKITARESAGDGKAPGKCIVEKSLANDRCREPCCFRIVTARPVRDELEVLSLARGCEARDKSAQKLADLAKTLMEKLTGVRSPNNNDAAFWANETYWQIAHEAVAEKNRNLGRLHKAIDGTGHLIAPDQLEELYMRLVRRVWDAGTARFRRVPEEKKIKRNDLLLWLREKLDQILHPAQAPGKRLEEKMGRALLPTDAVRTALEHRTLYLREIRRPKYLNVDERPLLEGEISACLLALRSKLDAGEIIDDGVQFHSRCLQQVGSIPTRLPSCKNAPSYFLFGCMYNITDRCLHRFTRAEA